MPTSKSLAKYTPEERDLISKVTANAEAAGYTVEQNAYVYNKYPEHREDNPTYDYIMIKNGDQPVGAISLETTKGTSLEGHPEKVASRIVPFSGLGRKDETPDSRYALYKKNAEIIKSVAGDLKEPDINERINKYAHGVFTRYEDVLKDEYNRGTFDKYFPCLLDNNESYDLLRQPFDFRLAEAALEGKDQEAVYKEYNPWAERKEMNGPQGDEIREKLDAAVSEKLIEYCDNAKKEWEKEADHKHDNFEM